mgnify:FL=1
MTEYVSRKRVNKMMAIFMVMIAYSLLLGILKGMLLDQLLCMMILDLVFCAILTFLLEQQRLSGRLCGNRTTDYNKVLTGVLLASLFGVVCGFFPAFVRPVLAIVIVVTGFSSEWLGLCIGIYYSIILSITCGMSMHEVFCYFMLTLSCSMLFAVWENPRLKKSFMIVMGCLQTLMPPLFYYLEYRKYNLRILLLSLLMGVVLTIVLHYGYEKMYDLREHEIDNLLQDMLEDEYAAAKELRRFSMKEYRHAKLVSKVARDCARIAGADETLCAVGGLYYRIGVLKGEYIAKNGKMVAAEKCFPEKVYQIIREYYGVLELPSTPESAIVQMIDGVLCRIEEMCANDELDEWNKDMVVYHTLTEFLSNGMYNNANLSMHKFLEIREYLVKEEPLL